MGITFKQAVLNKFDTEPRGYAEEVATKVGYSSGGALKKILKDEKKEFEKFNSLTSLAATVFPDDHKQKLAEYALTLDFNKQTARFMLEFSEANSLHDLRKELIDNMINCGNAQSREWAEIHQIDYKYMRSEISFMEALSLYGGQFPKTVEMKVYVEILKAYCYFDKQMFDMSEQITLPLESLINGIKEDYIRDAYLGRYYLILGECYTRKGSIEKARQVCFKVIDNVKSKAFVSWALLQMGNSYMIESYDKANHYLMKGYLLSMEVNEGTVNNLKRSINFLDNLWKKQPRHLNLDSNHPADSHEIAYYYINHKQFTKAMEVLNKDDMDKITPNQRGFHYYLKGLITNNIADICASAKAFKQSGDYYYLQLPLIQLKNFNIDTNIIELLAV